MASPRREITVEEEGQVREASPRREIPDEETEFIPKLVFIPKLETEFDPEVSALVEKGLSYRRAVLLDLITRGEERYDPEEVARWLALDRAEQELADARNNNN
ncbi:unnamed protein product [Linum trigynum]|uniref:Uncharacterized protein n=1 Tax=Linum trigynum TaxID=586398 RepID=A0AAV2CMG4_9ROSI